MARETEVKIRLGSESVAEMRERLSGLGARRLCGPSSESNLLFDFGDRRLTSQGCALRLRVYENRVVLTFKGPVQPHPTLKVRDEWQTAADDAEALRIILESIGLTVSFQYEKIREVYAVLIQCEEVTVALDQTPVGEFVELEGSPEAIRQLAARLGWGEDRFTNKNYVELYQEARSDSD